MAVVCLFAVEGFAGVVVLFAAVVIAAVAIGGVTVGACVYYFCTITTGC